MSQTRVDQDRGPAEPYTLDRKVGAGATSTVWQASCEDGAAVALKVGRTTAEAARLAVEALHASLALSPRLPELVHLGLAIVEGDVARPLAPGERADQAQPFLALRWVDGRLLDSDDGAQDGDPVELALAVARDLGEALADLHGLGLSHGDVKPANILRDHDGRLALLDLGLVGPAGAVALHGATPRYLGRGDRRLGDGRARDLLALGIVLAEIALPEIRDAAEPLEVARRLTVPAPLAKLTGALLAPDPGARPSARWVCDIATACGGDSASRQATQGERDRRSLRASYLRLRRREVLSAAEVHGKVAPWLTEAISVVRRAREMCSAAGCELPSPLAGSPASSLGPLTAEQRKHWLAALVGGAALDWPSAALAEVDEPALVNALDELASRKRPLVWNLTDLEAALGETAGAAGTSPVAPTETTAGDGPLDATAATHLTLRVSQLPLDLGAAETVEQLGDRVPPPLRLATADALRLAGHLGRARSLVLRPGVGGAIAADVLRRSGDFERARAVAEQQLASADDPGHRGRACLALMLLADGETDEAARLVKGQTSAATAEIEARIAIAQGDSTAALRHAERGRALATTPEEHARLAGIEAHVLQLSHAPDARRRFADAVAHAVRAGAVLEEATYRTGEDSACVDLGELEAAIDTARRAALL
ncbi:MAG: protein kinase, partial [Deltaproteobacteria bacterium]|nr:protein kinase [Deltaproteobacteria bacterium]